MGEEGVLVEGLYYRYPGSAEAAVAVDRLDVDPPFFLVILGPNGAGKTTLLKLLIGLLRPERGRVRILGVDPHNGGLRRLAGSLGYVPQLQRVNTNIPLRGWEVAAMRLYLTQRPPRSLRRSRREALEALEILGVGYLADKPFSEMSGGERQLTLLARAIAGSPRLLVADEPLGMVDPRRRLNVARSLWRLHVERGLNVIVTTHDITPFLQEPIASRALGALMNRRIIRLTILSDLLADRAAIEEAFKEYSGLGGALASLRGGA